MTEAWAPPREMLDRRTFFDAPASVRARVAAPVFAAPRPMDARQRAETIAADRKWACVWLAHARRCKAGGRPHDAIEALAKARDSWRRALWMGRAFPEVLGLVAMPPLLEAIAYGRQLCAPWESGRGDWPVEFGAARAGGAG
ncbi:hypothetical protein L0F51_04010 [Afifella sp. H1R]|uniref:hypothetical protein n=1 Tax=Afifella sp. H1R TaxID=2908841 RepID=UPI001F2B984A|nr:hypothetical protein [Afifella sp. H1R]MCF1502930.1 hypothetical protein [Afifella sp. H1R]